MRGKPAALTTSPRKERPAWRSSPFKFQKRGQSGIEVSELFSRTAQHIDDIAVIRLKNGRLGAHREPSLMLVNCGDSVLSAP